MSTVAGPESGLNEPCDAALDTAGDLIVAGRLNNKIFRFQANRIESLAGSSQGYKDGDGSQAQIHAPQTLRIGRNGIIYVGEYRGLRFRKPFREKPDRIEGRFEGCWAFAIGNGHSGRLCLNLEEKSFQGFVLWDDSDWGRIEGQWSDIRDRQFRAAAIVP